MFMDSELILLMVPVGIFVAGLVLGLLVGLRTNGSRRHARWLESELDRTRAELSSYQSRVTDHFAETAQVFNTFSDQYQAVYQHLASGCRELCRGDHPQIQHKPEAQALETAVTPPVQLRTGRATHTGPKAVSPSALNKAQEGLGIG